MLRHQVGVFGHAPGELDVPFVFDGGEGVVGGGGGDGDGVAAPVAHGETFEDVVVYEAAGLAARGVAVAVLGGGLAGVQKGCCVADAVCAGCAGGWVWISGGDVLQAPWLRCRRAYVRCFVDRSGAQARVRRLSLLN